MTLENLRAMTANLNMNEQQLQQLAIASGQTYEQMNTLDPDTFLELVETYSPPRHPPQPMEQNHDGHQHLQEAWVLGSRVMIGFLGLEQTPFNCEN